MSIGRKVRNKLEAILLETRTVAASLKATLPDIIIDEKRSRDQPIYFRAFETNAGNNQPRRR
ncbi:hypothetical protein [Bradyrhizobium sp. McL0616]|uniref:hypothetical protein n=1 Tax=Bradyrhizobium sp. McL0616 TaxID=3415674 RepID=UPI003CFA4D69